MNNLDSIILGTWAIGGWMWGGTDKKKSIDAIQVSIENGINSIDTAPVYGFGVSEEIVGEAIKPYKNKVKIFTKYGLVWHKNSNNHYFSSQTNDGKPIDVYKHAGKESIIYECEQSLKRLNIECIDLYQIHWPDKTTPIKETMEAVELLKKQGKIKEAGVSNYDKRLLEKANKYANILSNQVPYSIVNRGIEKELIPYCLKNNIRILAYSPLQRGLLTGKIKPGHNFKNGDHRRNEDFFSETFIEKTNTFLEEILPIANQKKKTVAQIILKYTAEINGISSVIVGARDKNQAIENASSNLVNFTEDELTYISSKIKEYF